MKLTTWTKRFWCDHDFQKAIDIYPSDTPGDFKKTRVYCPKCKLVKDVFKDDYQTIVAIQTIDKKIANQKGA